MEKIKKKILFKKDKDKNNMVGDIILDALKNYLSKMKLNEDYVSEFGIFRKTSEKEIMMTAWIEQPGIDTKHCKELVKQATESLGWTFKESIAMRYIGIVAEKVKNNEKKG